ncbi:helix-turn-helix transcriptional regulator [Streptomyces sp. RB110-1]|uniref:helix-turn-helix transcriptional regulator n=1 Tax=unclassified Streptomyces TaxID=2593676 RepID=UPI001900A0BC|nr:MULTISPECIES: AraC family transcriptional regulator [unclassified Streptomyces]MBK0373125.1 helix-turn-helix transcriptional regulator [Streptomyces sp. RB110-1]MBK0390507.1 helix-turn-helix transcriptional regulator [Streptomyces sp. RB110-2]
MDVVEFPFPATPGGPPGLEVTDLSGWARRVRRLGADTGTPVRPGFHLLFALHEGRLPCTVDLTECVIGGGQWLWVRPGQVFRLRSLRDSAAPRSRQGTDPEPRGTVILFQPSFLGAATVIAAQLDRRTWRLPLAPAPEAEAPVRQTLAMLESQYHRLSDLPLEVHVEVVRHLLSILVLRLSSLPGGHRRRAAGDDTFRRFQLAVEQDFARFHQVADYATALGYSVRTLTRATNTAVGRSAKGFIDDRLVTEAKRLLLHTDLAAHTVGERLGFPSATVFTRFFRTRSGETPAGFRARARVDGEGSGRG